MNIIVPMAGIGKRMRPHTFNMPKPLLKIAGKAIVQRLIEELGRSVNKKIENIGFVIGEFGRDVEEELLKIAGRINAKGHIFYQEEALGTAHAVYCADKLLKDEVVIAFADTLFKASFKIKSDRDSIIWIYEVEDPANFGVVKTDSEGRVTDFIEKPKDKISNRAIIGIYYFNNGNMLSKEIQDVIDNKVIIGGEYQLTTVLENMKNKGTGFYVNNVEEWLDCGNKDNFIHTNKRILEHLGENQLLKGKSSLLNTKVIKPCYIGDNVKIKDSVIGPYVSVEDNTQIQRSVISNSIIYENASIAGMLASNSIIGSNVIYTGKENELNLGDFSDYS